MRTKTLLFIAAVAAAGVVSSNAQVYSVNAVGYVNKTVPKSGYALIANPLTAATNTIAGLLGGQVPDNTVVFAWNTTTKAYETATYTGADFGWDYSPAALETKQFKPGSGFFVKNATTTDFTVTFVGEVPQGTLTTALVAGYQIVGSQVPQAGTVDQLGYVGTVGDVIFQWDATKQGYVSFGPYDPDFQWGGDLKPLEVGEAFFLQKNAAGTWTRTFSVN
jgi:hypothetical protein